MLSNTTDVQSVAGTLRQLGQSALLAKEGRFVKKVG